LYLYATHLGKRFFTAGSQRSKKSRHLSQRPQGHREELVLFPIPPLAGLETKIPFDLVASPTRSKILFTLPEISVLLTFNFLKFCKDFA
jgi:hypothetical protein